MPETIKKFNRDEIATFLDTTPNALSSTYALLGTGITSFAIAYNPQITTEKWIIHRNATSSLDSNQKQGDVSQKIYKNDPCFEFVKGLRDKTGGDVQVKILDVDTYDETSSGVYSAKLSDGMIAITSYGGEDAVLEYTIYYNGDPVERNSNNCRRSSNIYSKCVIIDYN